MGLLMGMESLEFHGKMLGVNVFQPNARQRVTLRNAMASTCSYPHLPMLDETRIHCRDSFYDRGYAQPMEELKLVIELVALTEGIFLDSVHAGKTMAGLIGLVRSEEIEKGSDVVMVNTGGMTTYCDYSSMAGLQN